MLGGELLCHCFGDGVVLSVAKELSEIKISDFTSLFDPRFFFDPRFLLYLPSKSPDKDETRTIRKPLL